MVDSRCSKIIENLSLAVKRERKAIGYPDRCGKITYSAEVRALAVQAAALSQVSLGDLAKISNLSPITLQNWCSKSSGFRELCVLPEPKEIDPQDGNLPCGSGAIEFAFPFGMRFIIEQKNEQKTFGVYFRLRS